MVTIERPWRGGWDTSGWLRGRTGGGEEGRRDGAGVGEGDGGWIGRGVGGGGTGRACGVGGGDGGGGGGGGGVGRTRGGGGGGGAGLGVCGRGAGGWVGGAGGVVRVQGKCQSCGMGNPVGTSTGGAVPAYAQLSPAAGCLPGAWAAEAGAVASSAAAPVSSRHTVAAASSLGARRPRARRSCGERAPGRSRDRRGGGPSGRGALSDLCGWGTWHTARACAARGRLSRRRTPVRPNGGPARISWRTAGQACGRMGGWAYAGTACRGTDAYAGTEMLRYGCVHRYGNAGVQIRTPARKCRGADSHAGAELSGRTRLSGPSGAVRQRADAPTTRPQLDV